MGLRRISSEGGHNTFTRSIWHLHPTRGPSPGKGREAETARAPWTQIRSPACARGKLSQKPFPGAGGHQPKGSFLSSVAEQEQKHEATRAWAWTWTWRSRRESQDDGRGACPRSASRRMRTRAEGRAVGWRWMADGGRSRPRGKLVEASFGGAEGPAFRRAGQTLSLLPRPCLFRRRTPPGLRANAGRAAHAAGIRIFLEAAAEGKSDGVVGSSWRARGLERGLTATKRALIHHQSLSLLSSLARPVLILRGRDKRCVQLKLAIATRNPSPSPPLSPTWSLLLRSNPRRFRSRRDARQPSCQEVTSCRGRMIYRFDHCAPIARACRDVDRGAWTDGRYHRAFA